MYVTSAKSQGTQKRTARSRRQNTVRPRRRRGGGTPTKNGTARDNRTAAPETLIHRGGQTPTSRGLQTPAEWSDLASRKNTDARTYATAAKTTPRTKGSTATALRAQGSNAEKEKDQAARPTQKAMNPGKKRDTAIMIRDANKDYDQILRSLKENTNLKNDGSITGTRKSRSGALLITVGKKDAARDMAAQIRKIMGGGANVRTLGDRRSTKIRGLDALVTTEELILAMESEVPTARENRDQTEVVRIYKYPWQEGAAIIETSRRVAVALSEASGLRVGWTRAEVISAVGQCFRCRGKGHEEWECRRYNRRPPGKPETRAGTDQMKMRGGIAIPVEQDAEEARPIGCSTRHEDMDLTGQTADSSRQHNG